MACQGQRSRRPLGDELREQEAEDRRVGQAVARSGRRRGRRRGRGVPSAAHSGPAIGISSAAKSSSPVQRADDARIAHRAGAARRAAAPGAAGPAAARSVSYVPIPIPSSAAAKPPMSDLAGLHLTPVLVALVRLQPRADERRHRLGHDDVLADRGHGMPDPRDERRRPRVGRQQDRWRRDLAMRGSHAGDATADRTTSSSTRTPVTTSAPSAWAASSWR